MTSVRRVMSREGAQPDFAVTDVGVIPAAHDGGQPTLVWVTAPEQPLAPHGFGNKVIAELGKRAPNKQCVQFRKSRVWIQVE